MNDRGEVTFELPYNKDYVCSRHGKQREGLRVSIHPKDAAPTLRHYCSECVIALLDEFCQQLDKP